MIKFVVFDFDGVFTDGKCHFNEYGVSKYYNIKDGKGLGILRDNGIITGLISSYKTDNDVVINNIPINKITSHLKFDKVSIGTHNKMSILKEWLNEFNIELNEVAYIGDDLPDLEILKIVGLSACPNDAITECKEVSDLICEKKGGEGCVREFVEYILNERNNVDRADLIIREIRKELNYQLDHFNVVDVYRVCNLIRECNGNIYFTGIGKSRNVAMECCILLKSINIKAFMLDAVECLHGDVGTIRPEDLVIMYSKSGNTIELVELIKSLNTKSVIRSEYVVTRIVNSKTLY
jgi:YrbI family 3-deoxy-D-manno-octulosonate 8-phosphate phosphatase